MATLPPPHAGPAEAFATATPALLCIWAGAQLCRHQASINEAVDRAVLRELRRGGRGAARARGHSGRAAGGRRASRRGALRRSRQLDP